MFARRLRPRRVRGWTPLVVTLMMFPKPICSTTTTAPSLSVTAQNRVTRSNVNAREAPGNEHGKDTAYSSWCYGHVTTIWHSSSRCLQHYNITMYQATKYIYSVDQTKSPRFRIKYIAIDVAIKLEINKSVWNGNISFPNISNNMLWCVRNLLSVKRHPLETGAYRGFRCCHLATALCRLPWRCGLDKSKLSLVVSRSGEVKNERKKEGWVRRQQPLIYTYYVHVISPPPKRPQ